MERMAEDMNEMKTTVAGLSKKVEELAMAMNIMREVILKERATQNKETGDGEHRESETEEEKTEDDTSSVGDKEKDIWKYRKLELPTFNGKDPLGWFFRIERYFQVSSINDSEKLGAGVVCLEGRVLSWYQWKEKRMLVSSWEEFKRELLERFHSSQPGGDYRILFALWQERFILEYVGV